MTKPRLGREKPPISLGEAVELISIPPRMPKLRPLTEEERTRAIIRGLEPDIRRGLRLR